MPKKPRTAHVDKALKTPKRSKWLSKKHQSKHTREGSKRNG